MKISHSLIITLLLTCGSSLHAGSPTVKAVQPVRSDQVSEGLAKSDWSSIRAAYEAGRHAAHREKDGTLTARNPGQQWRMEFDGKGFTVTPDHGQWTWGLELTGYGERTLSVSSPIFQEDGKITYQRDENLTEWFINDKRGLEQGWTIQRRPSLADSSAPLRLHLSTRGNLRPQVSPDGFSVSFHQESDGCALTFGGLKAWDADGKNLPVHFEQATENHLRIAIDEHSARYPITIDPVAQQAYLKASNTDIGDSFGGPVAVSGNTVVVGAYREKSNATGVNSPPPGQSNNSLTQAGAAYVFVRDGGGNWIQQAYLKASNTEAGDKFGGAVSVSGDSIGIGAIGEDSMATGVNGVQVDNIRPESGAAYVFARSGTVWSQQAYLKASFSSGGEAFGGSLSLSGDILLVGAAFERSAATGVDGNDPGTASDSGAAYLFARTGSYWGQWAYLKASNTGAYNFFGASVSVSDGTAIAGASGEDSNAMGVNGDQGNNLASGSGAAYVFELGTPPVIPAPNPFVITDSSFDGTYFTIHFTGQAGVTDWRVMGSPDLTSFSDDWTAGNTIYETSPGIYEVAVNLGEPPARYFLRIER